MFCYCKNLEYINFYNLNIYQTYLERSFTNVPDNIVVCIKEINDITLFSEMTSIKCPVIDCSSNWKSKQKKIINDTNECIESCENSTQYSYEYNGKCYGNCPNGLLNDDDGNIINKCKCELDNCSLCPPVALINNLCTKCNTNYYPKENDPKNLGEYINCYNGEQERYYLDNNLYKKCYDTCKKCNIGGNNENHNCIECEDNYPFKIMKSDSINCYENCSNYYYFDNEYNFHCTNDLSCPNEYKLKENSTECFKYDNIDNLINDILNNEKNITKK